MGTAPITSVKAVLALVLGLLSLACGILVFVSGTDLFLLGVAGFWLAALVLGIRSLLQIKRAPDRLRGKALAGWGIGVSSGGIALGFLLLPAT